MANNSTLAIPASEVMVVAMGGEARTMTEFGTDTVLQRDNLDVHRLSGVTASIGGLGLDGALIETGTPLDEVKAGTIFRAEGRVEVTFKAEAKVLQIGKEPVKAIPNLKVSVWIERLTPVGNAFDALPKTPVKTSGGASS